MSCYQGIAIDVTGGLQSVAPVAVTLYPAPHYSAPPSVWPVQTNDECVQNQNLSIEYLAGSSCLLRLRIQDRRQLADGAECGVEGRGQAGVTAAATLHCTLQTLLVTSSRSGSP